MRAYLDLLRKILETGEPHADRTGVGTTSLFGEVLHFDLHDGQTFPLVTTKRMPLRHIFYELQWFLSGSNDIRDLQKHGVSIWDANYNSASWKTSPYYEEHSVGANYGQQWRYFGTWVFDQIEALLFSLTHDPQSRRHIVTAWNPSEVSRTALPPCHVLFQTKVHHDESLSMSVYIRSADVFLGTPWNIASYALLLMMLARVVGRKANRLTVFLGDVHIYHTHRDAVLEQLSREPYSLPELRLPRRESHEPRVQSLLSYTFSDLELVNYKYHPAISAPMAV